MRARLASLTALVVTAGCAGAMTPAASRVAPPAGPAHAAPPVPRMPLDTSPPPNAVSRSVLDLAGAPAVAAPLLADAERRRGVAMLVDGALFVAPGAIERFAIDPARPLRSAEQEIAPTLRAFLDTLEDLAAQVPDAAASSTTPAELRRRAQEPQAVALRRALDRCPIAPSLLRQVLPTVDRARTVAALRATLGGGGGENAPTAINIDGYDFALVPPTQSAGTVFAVAGGEREVVLDTYVEPLRGCAPAALRSALPERARGALAAFRARTAEAARAQGAPVPLELAGAVYRTEFTPEGHAYFAAAIGVSSVLAALGMGSSDGGPSIDPDTATLLLAAGVREASAALRLARGPHGAFVQRAGYRLDREPAGLALTLEAERASGGYGPPDATPETGTRLLPEESDGYLDVSTAWLTGFALPGEASAAPFATSRFDDEVRNGGIGAMVMSVPFSAPAVVRALLRDGLWPFDTSAPPPARYVRVGVGRSPAGRVFTLSQFAPHTPPAEIACALATPATPCASVRLERGTTRAVPGGFARWITLGEMQAIALSTDRPTVDALTRVAETTPGTPVGGSFHLDLVHTGASARLRGPLGLLVGLAEVLSPTLADRYRFEFTRTGDVFSYAVRPIRPRP